MMKQTVRAVCTLTAAAGIVIGVFAVLSGPTSAAPSAPAVEARYLSPLAVIADKAGETLYVAEAAGHQVGVVDVASGTVTRNLPLPGEATGVALSPDGKRLYVTAGVGDGKLVVFDTTTGKQQEIVDAGHSPMAPVVGPDGVYVCDRFRNRVLIITPGGKTAQSIPVSRQPVGMGLGDGGKTLVVANHLPAGRADKDFTASVITLIDTGTNKVVKDILLPNGGADCRDIAISPDGKLACVTHILARYHLPTTQLERGWMNTNALTIVDVPKREILNTVLLDDVDNGAANAWGIAWTPDGRFICISLAGTHEVSVIDWEGLSKKLDAAVAAGKGEDVKNDLSFLVDLRRRLKVCGDGPRGLTTIGTKVYAAQYFSDSLCEVDVNPDIRPVPRCIPLGPKQPLTKVRKGHLFFNDARLCFQGWQSCASCHPDGRMDGLNWDLLNDGMGNPKSAKSMVLAHATPPAMITGVRAKAEIAVRAGIRFIQFAVRPEEDAVCIDEYLKSLRPVPSPFLVKGPNGELALSQSAQRGKKIFDDVGCGMCHEGPHYTDGGTYDVGTGTGREKGLKFDTPTLREVWRTGPYLYDGRAAIMEDAFTKFNIKDQHGATSKLNVRQIKDLCQYVLSL